jgi:hypothetical protein
VTNEEVLSAFEKYLQEDLECRRLMGPDTNRDRVLNDVCELTAAIDPRPLVKATEEEINSFICDQTPPPSSPVSDAPSLRKAEAELRLRGYKAAMLYFHYFRDAVLKRPIRQEKEG